MIMSGSLTSGTYAHTPSFAGVVRRFVGGLFGAGLTAAKPTHGDYMAAAIQFRVRARGARQLAERPCIQSSNVEAKLDAAASRHKEQGD